MMRGKPAAMVLMVSAEATMNRFSEAIEKDAAGFAVKPVNPAGVLDKVRVCLRGRERE